MVDQTGVVPVRRAEGDAGLPDDRMVRHRPSDVREMVDQNSASWNQVTSWLKQLDAFRIAL